MDIRQPNESEEQEIDSYLSKENNDLFSQIYEFYENQPERDFLPSRYRDLFPDLQERGEEEEEEEEEQFTNAYKGELFFEFISKAIYQRLCIDWDLCAKIDNASFADSSNLIIAIGDVITSAKLGIPIPILLTATTIVKIGGRKFCNCIKAD